MKKFSILTLASIGACAALASAFVAPAEGGTFTGTVKFEGDKPEMKPLAIDAEKAKGCVKEGEKLDTADPSLVIDDKGGIANVVVTVDVVGADGKPAAVKPAEKTVVLDQKSCHFTSHVAVVPVGSTVDFANSDTIGHNVHVFANKNDGFNELIAAGSKKTSKLDKEERIEIKCDIHTWMNSWLVVANTNYYAVTGPDGSFKVEGLPAGEYNVTYWHEKLGKQTGKIKVGADGKTEPVEIKMGMEKKGGGRKR